MPVATFPLGPLQTNSYLIHTAQQAVAVDAGGDPADMLAYLEQHGLTLAALCITHRHFDHMYGASALLEKTGATAYAFADDPCPAPTEISRGGLWGLPEVPPFPHTAITAGRHTLGGMDCEVLLTPGHAPDSISLYFPAEHVVFTGDALFYRSLGRTDFPGGNAKELLCSVREKLLTLPDDVTVYPGHGVSTSIGDEKRNNPFFGEFKM